MTIQFQLKRRVVEGPLASRFETKSSGQSDITGNLQRAGLQILTVKLELIFAGGQVEYPSALGDSGAGRLGLFKTQVIQHDLLVLPGEFGGELSQRFSISL